MVSFSCVITITICICFVYLHNIPTLTFLLLYLQPGSCRKDQTISQDSGCEQENILGGVEYGRCLVVLMNFVVVIAVAILILRELNNIICLFQG